jgi:hypothetical protein
MILMENFITYFFKKTIIRLKNINNLKVCLIFTGQTTALMLKQNSKALLSKYISLPVTCLVKITPNNIVSNFLNSIPTKFYHNSILNSINTFQTFYKQLSLKGTGFKIVRNSKENYLECKIGFTDKKYYILPPSQTCSIIINKGVLTFISQDKNLLGNTSAVLKDFRRPNAYTGKGLFYFKTPPTLKPTKKQ